jgi:hypothetical protein
MCDTAKALGAGAGDATARQGGCQPSPPPPPPPSKAPSDFHPLVDWKEWSKAAELRPTLPPVEESARYFVKDSDTEWRCLVCGRVCTRLNYVDNHCVMAHGARSVLVGAQQH